MTVEWYTEEAKLQINMTLEKLTAGAIKGVHMAALDVQAEVQRTSPIDTGQYRSEIRTEEPVVSDVSIEVTIGSPAPQSARLEYGYMGLTDSLGRTFYQAPRPHWRPAFDLGKQNCEAIIGKYIRQEKGE